MIDDIRSEGKLATFVQQVSPNGCSCDCICKCRCSCQPAEIFATDIYDPGYSIYFDWFSHKGEAPG